MVIVKKIFVAFWILGALCASDCSGPDLEETSDDSDKRGSNNKNIQDHNIESNNIKSDSLNNSKGMPLKRHKLTIRDKNPSSKSTNQSVSNSLDEKIPCVNDMDYYDSHFDFSDLNEYDNEDDEISTRGNDEEEGYYDDLEDNENFRENDPNGTRDSNSHYTPNDSNDNEDNDGASYYQNNNGTEQNIDYTFSNVDGSKNTKTSENDIKYVKIFEKGTNLTPEEAIWEERNMNMIRYKLHNKRAKLNIRWNEPTPPELVEQVKQEIRNEEKVKQESIKEKLKDFLKREDISKNYAEKELEVNKNIFIKNKFVISCAPMTNLKLKKVRFKQDPSNKEIEAPIKGREKYGLEFLLGTKIFNCRYEDRNDWIARVQYKLTALGLANIVSENISELTTNEIKNCYFIIHATPRDSCTKCKDNEPINFKENYSCVKIKPPFLEEVIHIDCIEVVRFD